MRQMLKAVAMLALAVGATNVPLAQNRQVAPDVPPEFRFLVRGSVGSAKQLQEAWDALPLDSITLERTQCFGACPAYSVTFYKRTAAVKKGEQTYENAFGRAELVVTVPGRSAPPIRTIPRGDWHVHRLGSSIYLCALVIAHPHSGLCSDAGGLLEKCLRVRLIWDGGQRHGTIEKNRRGRVADATMEHRTGD